MKQPAADDKERLEAARAWAQALSNEDRQHLSVLLLEEYRNGQHDGALAERNRRDVE